jgi:SAM-dependent methyltransferase
MSRETASLPPPMDQTVRLRRCFTPPNWRSALDRWPRSGFALADEIARLRPRFVVDVGCGYNEFKGRIRNLIGIDLVNPCADLVCDLREAPLRAGAFDVALALGSINFGNEANVVADLSVVCSWLRPGGILYLRGNPGETLAADEEVVIFPWSRDNIPEIGRRAGFVLGSAIEEERLEEADGRRLTRLFWSYVKP